MTIGTSSSTNKLSILQITIVAALGGLLFGYDTGVIGGSQLYFTKYFNLSAAEQGWAVSSALYGKQEVYADPRGRSVCYLGLGFWSRSNP
jgi:hypothetical protein